MYSRNPKIICILTIFMAIAILFDAYRTLNSPKVNAAQVTKEIPEKPSLVGEVIYGNIRSPLLEFKNTPEQHFVLGLDERRKLTIKPYEAQSKDAAENAHQEDLTDTVFDICADRQGYFCAVFRGNKLYRLEKDATTGEPKLSLVKARRIRTK